MNNKQKYIDGEFNHMIYNVMPENRQYKPKLQISHCGSKTRHIDITWEQLEAIRQLLIDTSESE